MFSNQSSFDSRPGAWTSGPSGLGCPHRNASFFKGFRLPYRSFSLERLHGYLGGGPQDIRPRSLPLWAAFSFLIIELGFRERINGDLNTVI